MLILSYTMFELGINDSSLPYIAIEFTETLSGYSIKCSKNINIKRLNCITIELNNSAISYYCECVTTIWKGVVDILLHLKV